MQTRRIDTDGAIFDLAAHQHGVVGRWQLRERGIEAHTELRRRRSGLLVPAYGDSYYVGATGRAPSYDAVVHAAVIAGGPDGLVGDQELARRLGCWNRPDGRIDVCTDVHRGFDSDGMVWTHVLQDLPPPTRRCDAAGILGIGIELAIARMAASLTRFQVPYVLTRAEVAGILDRGEVERLLRARRGHRGMATFRAGWQLYLDGSSGTANGGEDRFLELILPHLSEPLVNVRDAAGVAGTVPDFAWPARGRAVELDGRRTHGLPGMAAADARRDSAYRAAGWLVLRIAAWRLYHDPGGVVREVVAFVGRGS